ncbi:endonuclease domain-containing protein [Pacificimonas flava]|uniref:endonuclease domain-containing protein n=1 Tax=Pacificimonas flava TaxID=1234595 RepID=UPI00098EF480|nr:endonuclease domain-containing protein [Pacificimonas flava]
MPKPSPAPAKNRAQLTPAETRLWSALRAGQLAGLKFTKQAIFEPYIADFACRAARLIVEIDGDSHAFRQDYDERRTAFLAAKGYRVIRFTNADVLEALDWVLHEIAQAAKPSPNPSLPERGEEQHVPLPGREGLGEGHATAPTETAPKAPKRPHP